MTPHAIISYDDTENDRDALALGRRLADAGTRLTLAYVRHTSQHEHDREALEVHEAQALLERGAHGLEDPDVQRRVVLSGSTGDGLGWLAAEESADIIIFGSDYRTPLRHVALGRSTQTLLERGPAALAIAPAGYHGDHTHPIDTIGILPGSADEASVETAFSLAGRFGARVVDRARGVDLLVVGSRHEAPEGRVMISSRCHNAIEEATSPVLVVARGLALHFDTLVAA